MQSIASITSDTRTSGPFTTPISRSDLQILLHVADVAGRRLVRLKSSIRPAAALVRSPARSPHRAARLAARVPATAVCSRRSRSTAKVTPVGDAIADSSGYLAMMGQPTDGFAGRIWRSVPISGTSKLILRARAPPLLQSSVGVVLPTPATPRSEFRGVENAAVDEAPVPTNGETYVFHLQGRTYRPNSR
jgi:hypothetical protein